MFWTSSGLHAPHTTKGRVPQLKTHLYRICLRTRSVMNPPGDASAATGWPLAATGWATGVGQNSPPSTKTASIVSQKCSNSAAEFTMSWPFASNTRKNATVMMPQSALTPASRRNFGCIFASMDSARCRSSVLQRVSLAL